MKKKTKKINIKKLLEKYRLFILLGIIAIFVLVLIVNFYSGISS